MIKNTVKYCDVIKKNLITNNQDRIFSFSTYRKGATNLTLSFSNIKLPKNSYVEFEYKNKYIQRELFHQTNKPVITFPGEHVNIRVILTKASNLNDTYSFELESIEYDAKSTNIITQNETKIISYNEDIEIANHALTVGAVNIKNIGTCTLIGNKNNVLTSENMTIYMNTGSLDYGEVSFNLPNQYSDPDSPVNEPIRLKPDAVVKWGTDNFPSSSGGAPFKLVGYSLFTLDTFDYENSNIKTLFGGLGISNSNPPTGTRIYVPYYNRATDSIDISGVDDNDPAQVTDYVSGNRNNVVTFDASISSERRGVPLISKESNKLCGMVSSGSVGFSATRLNSGLSLGAAGNPVIGLGNVRSFNLEITPFTMLSSLIPVDLDKKGVIFPFNTVKIYNYDHYSLIEVEAIDLLTDEKFPLTFKASLISDDDQNNIQDNNISGEVFLKIYDFNINVNRLVKFWTVFSIDDPLNNVKNYVIRTVLDYEDVYAIPFDIDDAEVFDFDILKADKLIQSSVSCTIEKRDTYGFIAYYRGQGPMELVGDDDGYSEVKALLKNSSGDEVLVNLRGMRKTECSTHTMNSTIACGSANRYSELILSFHPEDNENLIFNTNDVYRGIIPLQAKQSVSLSTKNILINVNLKTDPYWSGPEELHPIWSPYGIYYYEGNVVEYSQHIYICIQDNVSNGSNAPNIDGRFWRLIA